MTEIQILEGQKDVSSQEGTTLKKKKKKKKTRVSGFVTGWKFLSFCQQMQIEKIILNYWFYLVASGFGS